MGDRRVEIEEPVVTGRTDILEAAETVLRLWKVARRVSLGKDLGNRASEGSAMRLKRPTMTKEA